MAVEKNLAHYADYEQNYINKGYYIEFYHIPSGKSVSFKSILTQFNDSFTSNWNDKEVYGRNDTISTFQGTKRNIVLGWSIPAYSLDDAINNMRKVQLFTSMMYPSYGNLGDASTIAAAPLFRLSFANLVKNYGTEKNELISSPDLKEELKPQRSTSAELDGLVGKIDSISPEWVIDDGFFDPEVGKLYPKTINISINYTVFHTHPLGWDKNKNFRTANFPYGEDLNQTKDRDLSKINEESVSRDEEKILAQREYEQTLLLEKKLS